MEGNYSQQDSIGQLHTCSFFISVIMFRANVIYAVKHVKMFVGMVIPSANRENTV